jgi:lysophospholipase L1-like esterase
VRTYISGATLLVVGVVIGLLISPGVRGEVSRPGQASAVTHTTSPTGGSTGSAGATGSAGSSGSAAGSTGGTTTSAPGSSGSPAAGASSLFDPARPVTVGLGDSITFNPDSWFRQLCVGQVTLENCLNAGIRGNTTTQMLARLDSDVLVYKPAVVFLMGGTNDLKRHDSTQAILRRLDIIIDRTRATGAMTILCTIPPRNHYGKQVLSLNAAIRRYAARGNVPLLDLYESVGTRTGVYKRGLTRDGIHPNLKGSDLMTALAQQQIPTLLHPIRSSGQLGRLVPNR